MSREHRRHHQDYTRETFMADLSDVQPHRLYRGEKGEDIVVGDRGPLGRCLIEGEPGWEIVPEVSPAEGEAIFNKRADAATVTKFAVMDDGKDASEVGHSTPRSSSLSHSPRRSSTDSNRGISSIAQRATEQTRSTSTRSATTKARQ